MAGRAGVLPGVLGRLCLVAGMTEIPLKIQPPEVKADRESIARAARIAFTDEEGALLLNMDTLSFRKYCRRYDIETPNQRQNKWRCTMRAYDDRDQKIIDEEHANAVSALEAAKGALEDDKVRRVEVEKRVTQMMEDMPAEVQVKYEGLEAAKSHLESAEVKAKIKELALPNEAAKEALDDLGVEVDLPAARPDASVERYEDMSERGYLRLTEEANGDMAILIHLDHGEKAVVASLCLRFGRPIHKDNSQHTHTALGALMMAMTRDNAESPQDRK